MSHLQAAVPSKAPMALMHAAVNQFNKEGTVMEPSGLNARQQAIIQEIERLVETGQQKEVTTFFDNWAEIPPRLGDWQFRVNYRRVDNAVVGRTVVALPLTRAARMIFEQGCMTTLARHGFPPEDAARYYKYAWKRQYVWVETVLGAVSEMIAAFRTTDVPRSYLETGDPRRLADAVSVPKNPFLVAHNHFIVAAEMAILVIDARNREQAEYPLVDRRKATSDNDQATA